MFPQYGPQMTGTSQMMGNSYNVNAPNAQGINLLGNHPFLTNNQPYNPNTTAPSSGGAAPEMQNMIKALQGGR